MRKKKKANISSMSGIFPFIVLAGFITLSMMAWQRHIDSITGYDQSSIDNVTRTLIAIDHEEAKRTSSKHAKHTTKLDTMAQIDNAQRMLETFMADDGEPVQVKCGKKCL